MQVLPLVPLSFDSTLIGEGPLLMGHSRTLSRFIETNPAYAKHFQSDIPLREKLQSTLKEQRDLAPRTLWESARKIADTNEFRKGVLSGATGSLYGSILGGLPSFWISGLGGAREMLGSLFVGSYFGAIGGAASGYLSVGSVSGALGGLIAGIGTAFSVTYGVQDHSWTLGLDGTLASVALGMGVSIFGNAHSAIASEIKEHRTHNRFLPAQKAGLDARISEINAAMTTEAVTQVIIKDPELYKIYYLEKEVLPYFERQLKIAQSTADQLERFLSGYDTDVRDVRVIFSHDTDRDKIIPYLLANLAAKKAQAKAELSTAQKSCSLIDSLIHFYEAHIADVEAIIKERATQESVLKEYSKLSDAEIIELLDKSTATKMAQLLVDADKEWRKIVKGK